MRYKFYAFVFVVFDYRPKYQISTIDYSIVVVVPRSQSLALNKINFAGKIS